MNVFARLIDPAAAVPALNTLDCRVHVLADEIDHTTMLPASKPGPKRGTNCPIVGLPRYEMSYERDESVCVVTLPTGPALVDVYLPVMVARTTKATVVDAPTLTGPPRKPRPVDDLRPCRCGALSGKCNCEAMNPIPRKVPPAAEPGPKAYRVAAK
jgi:hypothetical protein